MAKGNSRRGNAHTSSQSLTSLLALPKPSPLVAPADIWEHHHNALQQAVLKSEDRRQYAPDKPSRGPGALIKRATQLHVGLTGRGVSRDAKKETLPATVRFRMPTHVSICVRRKIRREVYLAKTPHHKRGKASSRRRNAWSSVKC